MLYTKKEFVNVDDGEIKLFTDEECTMQINLVDIDKESNEDGKFQFTLKKG